MDRLSYRAELVSLLADLGVDFSVYHDAEDQESLVYIGDNYHFTFDENGDELVNYGALIDGETE